MSRVADFYGMDDKEFLRRHGDLLENNLQGFRDAIYYTVLEWIADRPELWRGDLPDLLAEVRPDVFSDSGPIQYPRQEEEDDGDRVADDGYTDAE